MIEVAGLALAGLAILSGGLLKGAIGMGAPLVSVPVLAGIYGVRTAIAVMTVPLIVSNLWQMWTYRRAREGRDALRRLLAGCAAGVVAGTFLLGVISEAWLAVGLALLLLAYLALSLAKPDVALAPGKARRIAAPAGVLIGILQGAAGLSSPVSLTFMHAQHLPREAYAFAVSAVFTVLSVTQLASLSAVGLMTWRLAAASLAALLPILFGMWLGQRVGDRFSRRTFEQVVFAVLAAVGLVLLAKAVPEILAGAP